MRLAQIHDGPTRRRATSPITLGQTGRRAACSVGFKANLQYLDTSTWSTCWAWVFQRAHDHVHYNLQDGEKKGGQLDSPSSPDGVTAAPIYLMLGLPAFDQSAAGDEPSSGPSPNTFPTLLGPGIALALTLRPSPPSGPKDKRRDLHILLPPAPRELSVTLH